MSLADCTAFPAGVTSEYLNAALDSNWARREWRTANSPDFPDAQIARFDYSSTTATQPSDIWYFKSDATTRTTLGHETLSAGNVATREQFVGWVESKTLAAGASETIDYTAKQLLPAGADRSEQLVRTFSASRETTLPGGRVDTCVIDTVRRAAASGGALSDQSTERLHYAPGLGVVKRYFTRTNMNFVLIDRNQTYLNELVSSSKAVPYTTEPPGSTPSLSACAGIAGNQLLQYTASNGQEALSDKRRTLAGSFNGTPSTLVSQRSMRTDGLSKISYFDQSLGALRELGYEIYGTSGQVTDTATFSGRPDLSGTAVGGSVTYDETTTNGTSTTSTDTFTFVGHEKVATYAGDFDTCKLQFDYGTGNREVFYLAPDAYWVRLDATVNGVRTTREMVKLN